MSDTLADPDGGDHRATASTVEDHGQRAPGPAEVEAFTVFYRGAAPKLVAFLRWHGARLPDAADCAQEALTLAFRQWSTLRHPYAWCRQVASRLYARRVGTLHEHPVDDLDSAAGSPLIAPETHLDDLEQRHTVLALLDQLPPRQRQVMAWTYDGATPTEIAEALQITPEAVRSNLYKARTALRSLTGESR
jgi:RNA polymerase sigma-70 factor (ECF subfamily)